MKKIMMAVAALAALVPGCGSHKDVGVGVSVGVGSHEYSVDVGVHGMTPETGPCTHDHDVVAADPVDGEGPTLTYANGHPLTWRTQDERVLEDEERLHHLVNALRVAQGVGALSMNGTMRECARGHARHMTVGSHDFFEHVNPEGDGPSARLCATGMPGGAGENIAKGHRTADEAVQAWIASPAHYANLVSGAYAETGLGTQRDEATGAAFRVQLFR